MDGDSFEIVEFEVGGKDALTRAERRLRTVAVTGAAGSLGPSLVRRLIEAGYGRIRAIDRVPLDLSRYLPGPVQAWIADLSKPYQARAAFEGVSDVIHLAAADFGRPARVSNPAAVAQEIALHKTVAEAASNAAVRRFTLASSPISDPEADTESAIKAAAERFAMQQDFSLRIGRLHAVLAHNERKPRAALRVGPALLEDLLQAARMQRPILTLKSSGDVTRAFLSARDAAEALQRLHESSHRNPLEIGGQSHTLEELLDVAEELLGLKLVRRRQARETLEPKARRCDDRAMERALGFTPSDDLKAATLSYLEAAEESLLRQSQRALSSLSRTEGQ